LKIDDEFCKHIERGEVLGWRSCLEHGRSAFPDRGIAITEIAGAPVCFAGVDSPFSQSVGLGLNAAVSDEHIQAITEFYHSQSAPARLVTSPVAGDELSRKLIAHGFTVEEYENVLAGDVRRMDGEHDPRVDVCTDAELWAEYSARAFEDGAEPSNALRFISILIASHPDVSALILRENGEIVTTGCLGIERNGVAGFFGTSTSPAARGRGYQTALIRDRIARARERGAVLARASARPGSASERNFRRCGFQVLYTRTTWIRALPAA
jgi:GNAT superfamily N-acetyltransferase